MNRTQISEKRASGYRRRITGLENAAFFTASPASGMYSTLDDLLLWQQALSTDKLLTQKSKDLMWSIVPSGNAYGWLVSNKSIGNRTEKDSFIITEGTVPGYFAWTARLPKDKQTIILLSNIRAGTNYLPIISEAITNILHYQSYQKPKISIAETLFPTIKQKGVAAALAQYRELKSKQFDSYNFIENELNDLGYGLLNASKIKEAIEILKLNVEIFPQSANVYDSLGEAYMRDGDKEQALVNYQKSADLNPNNTNAIEMLKKLKSK